MWRDCFEIIGILVVFNDNLVLLVKEMFVIMGVNFDVNDILIVYCLLLMKKVKDWLIVKFI